MSYAWHNNILQDECYEEDDIFHEITMVDSISSAIGYSDGIHCLNVKKWQDDYSHSIGHWPAMTTGVMPPVLEQSLLSSPQQRKETREVKKETTPKPDVKSIKIMPAWVSSKFLSHQPKSELQAIQIQLPNYQLENCWL
jgi:hypothetical protein